MTIPATELAYRLCNQAHPLLRTTGATVPCGPHLTEANRLYGLIEPAGRETLAIVNAAAMASSAKDDAPDAAAGPCDHIVVGSLAPMIKGEWACLRCGQRFMPDAEDRALAVLRGIDTMPAPASAEEEVAVIRGRIRRFLDATISGLEQVTIDELTPMVDEAQLPLVEAAASAPNGDALQVDG